MSNDDATISNEQLAALLAELVELKRALVDLVQQNQELIDELRQKERRISELEDEVDRWRKEAKRQAAPYRRRESRKKPKTKHKSSGRKKGHDGAHRPPPDEDEVDEEYEVPLCGCPHCGGDVDDERALEQYVEDIEVRRVVRKITTYSATCSTCGRVRTHHPLQVSRATGAAGVQIGPMALSIAIDLNKRLGLTLRKTSEVLERHFGISVTAGGLVHASHRLADELEQNYEGLIEQLRRRAAIYVDETSWWVGEPSWLWTFTDDEDITVYSVESRRNREVVEETLGKHFEGVLSSDCLNIYDNHRYTQNKCYAHHLRAISRARRDAPDSEYLADWQLLLTAAMAAQPDAPRPIDDELLQRFEKWADQLLQSPRTLEVEEGVRNRLKKQRKHLFTFLKHPGVDPTNNAAERALRPAVIARKLSCGNRTERGAKTWEILASLAATYDRRDDEHFAELIQRAAKLQPEQPQAPPV